MGPPAEQADGLSRSLTANFSPSACLLAVDTVLVIGPMVVGTAEGVICTVALHRS